MNTEDYVSFGTAELLKKAGFDQKTECGYNPDGSFVEHYLAAHLWTVVKWLREDKRLHVCIAVSNVPGYAYLVWHTARSMPTPNIEGTMELVASDDLYGTYEAAADAAIAAACQWLIKNPNK